MSLHPQRIAITGSSGYLGSRLIRHIRAISPRAKILGLDVGPSERSDPHEFTRIDIRQPSLKSVLEDFQPDTVVHLAFIVNPIHDEVLMTDINVNGSRNLFEAVAGIGVKRFLVASSATAFGAWPDNPLPLDDLDPIRGRTDFSYSADKAELERMLSEFEVQHPEMAVSWIRPCIIYGPGVDNYLSRMLLNHPLVVLPDGHDLPQQFVHEEDVAAATWHILTRDGRGPYNVAPPDWIHLSDVARETGRRTIRIPFWMMKYASRVCWKWRLPFLRYPPGCSYYIRYSWIVAPRRLCDELGFRFLSSSLDTLRDILRSHGKLKVSRAPICKPSENETTFPRRRSA